MGGLNVTYSTGPNPDATLSMENIMEDKYTPIWNVMGVINGTHADETVVLGNHRDAWIIGGAGDPNSGTAVLAELTKAFGLLLETGWKVSLFALFWLFWGVKLSPSNMILEKTILTRILAEEKYCHLFMGCRGVWYCWVN